jgi:hypothetical protein
MGARKKCKGTPLSVFCGKEKKLNLVILLVLYLKSPLAKYDVFLAVRRMKGFRNIDSKTICQRMDALLEQGWIAQNGVRLAKVVGEIAIYELTLLGKIAAKCGPKTFDEFLKSRTKEQLCKFIEIID